MFKADTLIDNKSSQPGLQLVWNWDSVPWNYDKHESSSQILSAFEGEPAFQSYLESDLVLQECQI